MLLLAPTASAATLEIGFSFPAEGEVLSGPLRAEGWVRYDPGSDGPYFLPSTDGSGPQFPVTLDVTPADLDRAEEGGIHLNQPRLYTTSRNSTWNASMQGLLVDGLYHVEATATMDELTATARRDIRVRNGLWLEVDSVETIPDFDGQPRALRVTGRAGYAPVAVAVRFEPDLPASMANSTLRPINHVGRSMVAGLVEITSLDDGYRFVATTSAPEPTGTHWVGPTETVQPPGDRPDRPAAAPHERDEGTAEGRTDAATQGPTDGEGMAYASTEDASPRARSDDVLDVSMILRMPMNGSVSVQAYRRPPPDLQNGTLVEDFGNLDGPASLVRTWREPVLFQTLPGVRTMTMAPCAEGQDPDPMDGTDPCHRAVRFGAPSNTFVAAAPALGAAATVTVATIGFAFTESGRYALGLFSRIKGPTVLEQPRREALYAAVRQQPGVRFGQLRRDFALGNGVLAHHLAALEREGLIRRHQRGVHVHFLPIGQPMAALQPETLLSPAGNALLRAAAGAGWHAQADLARSLGLSRQAVHDQVRRLHREGLLELDDRGRVRRAAAPGGSLQ
jgi:predicted DNA-binding transcriptional regulator